MKTNTPMSIHKLALFFRNNYPDSAISETAIRKLIRAGEIKSCRVGVKYVATPDSVLEYYIGGKRGGE